MSQPSVTADRPATSYDEVPYESLPFAQTHPDRLASVATLFGMRPAPADRCRVLELGCAAGGNLIPMALALPRSRFLGIDLSGRQVADGLKVVGALGLSNIELKQLSISEVDAGWGPFDYIVCHGVYSWVPPAVQDKILEICATNLAPQGVAYVSYNTYPGWHMRGMLRDIMCYHARRFADPRERVGQARALLDFLARSVPRQSGPYGILLKEEVEQLRDKLDSYLLHEHLEEFNEPIYFYQFAERAAARGLRYLGEANVAMMGDRAFPADVQETLRRVSSNLIHMEQYMDFLRNRTFRQTLLCRKDVRVRHQLGPEQLTPFCVASRARPVSAEPDVRSDKVEHFKVADIATLTTPDPLVKACMVYLAEVWPRAVPFEDLRGEARARLDPGSGPSPETDALDREVLGVHLLHCYTSSSLVELWLQPPRFTTEVTERPVASPLARLQAQAGGPVTNLRHEVVRLGQAERQTLRLLDGSRDRAGLHTGVLDLVARGVLVVKENGQPVADPARIGDLVNTILSNSLSRLAREALLVG